MAVYNYQASDANGKMRTGVLTAETLEEALGRIAEANLVPVDLQRMSGGSTEGWWEQIQSRYLPVPTQDLIVFTKQLVTMVRVGIPITQAFDILKDQTEQPRLRRLAGVIRDDVEAGTSLSLAMGKHPSVFTPLYCSMVEAGEASGTLPEVLDRLLYLIEHEAMVKAEVRTAMRYPIMVIVALAMAFIIMLSFVIPRFVGFFEQAGLDLPLPTQICISLSKFLTAYGPWIAIGTVGAGFALHRLLNHTERGRLIRDRALLHTPLIGPVFMKAAMSRFASIFAILQSSGVLVLDALRILSETVGNAAIAAEFEKVRSMLEEGHGIADPLRAAKYFPPMLINMVAIGEESGRLDEMLREVSAHYDVEVRYTMKKMTDSIGPILIVSLTFVVGFFALAIYMPMWDLTQMATRN